MLYLRSHAAARIEHDTDGKRHILAAKRNDFLLHLVFINLEDILAQSRDEMVQRIDYTHRHQHYIGVDADISLGLSVSGIPGEQASRKCSQHDGETWQTHRRRALLCRTSFRLST